MIKLAKTVWGFAMGGLGGLMPYLLAGAVVAGLAGTIYLERMWREQAELRAINAEQNAGVAKQVAIDNFAAGMEMAAQGQRSAEAVVEISAEKVGDVKKSSEIIRKVEHVPAQPLSPVFSCYLGLLREQADRDLPPEAGTAEDIRQRGAVDVRAACGPANGQH